MVTYCTIINFSVDQNNTSTKQLNNNNNNNDNVDNNNNNINDNSNNKPFIVLPYIKHLNDSLKRNLRKYKISLENSNINKFNSLIKLGKDKITNENRNNIVFRIPCNDCDCIYIGQSKQKF